MADRTSAGVVVGVTWKIEPGHRCLSPPWRCGETLIGVRKLVMEASERYLAPATTWMFLPPPISPDHLDGAGSQGEKEPVAEYEAAS